MSTIKTLREKSGFTQMDLAKKTGLSLRTIQRLETGNKKPKGYSLKVLSDVFNVDPSVMRAEFLTHSQTQEKDRLSIKLINLSALAVLGIPFGNLILPLIVWSKRKESKLVDEAGRKIINFQIIWSIILCFSLCISPFIDIGSSDSFPLILLVLFIALGINLVVICATAMSIQSGKNDFLDLPIQLF